MILSLTFIILDIYQNKEMWENGHKVLSLNCPPVKESQEFVKQRAPGNYILKLLIMNRFMTWPNIPLIFLPKVLILLQVLMSILSIYFSERNFHRSFMVHRSLSNWEWPTLSLHLTSWPWIKVHVTPYI